MRHNVKSLLIICIIAAGTLFLAARFLGNPTAAAFEFVWSIEAAIARPFNAVFETRRLSDELAACQRSYGQALTELSAFRQIEKENAALRAQLNLGKRPAPALMAGHLVYAEQGLGTNRFLMRLENALPSDPFRQSSGEASSRAAADGVGRPVVSNGNALIGKVSRVSGQYAWVNFISDAGSVISALTSQSAIKGIVRGGVDGRLTMELTRHEQLPLAGEAVLTDTLDPNVPPNLLIGTVSQVQAGVSDLLNSVEITPAAVLPISEPIFIIESW